MHSCSIRCRKDVRLTPTEVKTYKNLETFELFYPFAIILIHEQNAKFSAFDSGVFLEKKNTANAMIRWQLLRAFERGARRDHTPNIGLK